MQAIEPDANHTSDYEGIRLADQMDSIKDRGQSREREQFPRPIEAFELPSFLANSIEDHSHSHFIRCS
jgi:hypothetical protein